MENEKLKSCIIDESLREDVVNFVTQGIDHISNRVHNSFKEENEDNCLKDLKSLCDIVDEFRKDGTLYLIMKMFSGIVHLYDAAMLADYYETDEERIKGKEYLEMGMPKKYLEQWIKDLQEME